MSQPLRIAPDILALTDYDCEDPSTYLDPQMHPGLAGHPYIGWKTASTPVEAANDNEAGRVAA